MEKKSQSEILDSLTKDDYKNIILPTDDFFDEESFSSSYSESEEKKEQKKKKFRFGHNIYESYSSYYLSETVLKIDSQNIKFVKKININEFTVYNPSLPWFNENLFTILVDFCKKEKKSIFFSPDFILNDVSGKLLLEKIPKFKENIHCLKDWIDKNKKYDLIGEVSIDYLTNPKSKKFNQTKKYINIINLFKLIENEVNINSNIKTKFEALFNLVYGNEKILVITTDGNYEQYLQNLKISKIFKNDKDSEDKNISEAINILKLIKNSQINFIVLYVPRSYVNVKYTYSDNNKIMKLEEDLKKLTDKVAIENKKLNDKISELRKENKDLHDNVTILKTENKDLHDNVTILKTENKDLNKKVKELTKYNMD